MTNNNFDKLFGIKVRAKDSEILQIHMDIAASLQSIIEEILFKITKNLAKKYNIKNLCLAGGVALNCVANGKIVLNKIVENIWIQPAAGDAGGAVGAALSFWFEAKKKDRKLNTTQIDFMKGSYLGNSYNLEECKIELNRLGAKYNFFEDENLLKFVAQRIADGNAVGWFQGKMEFGPRALGNRSILADPRSDIMQSNLNLKIKYRESFRPFAPAVIEENVSQYFDLNCKSPYMLLVAKVRNEYLIENQNHLKLEGLDLLKLKRSLLPAITHVDNSARVQTVNKKTNRKFYNLIQEFEKITGYPILINTSFNIRDEPIVCTIEDAYRCFLVTNLDYLIIENFVLTRNEQISDYNLNNILY